MDEDPKHKAAVKVKIEKDRRFAAEDGGPIDHKGIAGTEKFRPSRIPNVRGQRYRSQGKKDPKGGLWFGCLHEDRNRFYRGKFLLIIPISL